MTVNGNRMGKLIKLSDYQTLEEEATAQTRQSGWVPVEFAVGIANRRQCLSKITDYGLSAIHIRMINSDPNDLLYLLDIDDAIWLNKQILEQESICEKEITHRIDLIQMLENVNM